ncbi:hypothetical protein KC19_8G156900 [Ceratodon purpureus]|uniref:Fe2OG dioxygenase domain-containing protein n=1 Tax=Ceratodon purpureus TaxID=3225 RepID=A0A8T0H7H2_CERPU|nr:hypothetical protein KC19_8G156900 [Ceratodon purpureus]
MGSLKSDLQVNGGLDPGPEMVQDMVEHGLMEVPLAFIRPPHERALLQRRIETPRLPFPVIDMAMLGVDRQSKKTVEDQTIRACEEWGFFRVVNHGVSETLMDAAMDVAKGFYALSAADKAEFRVREGGGVGYGRYFESAGAPKDWVDRLVLITVNKDANEEPYDIVLDKPPGSHQVLTRYGDAIHELARKILAILSEGLGQSPDFLCNQFAGEAAPLRTSLNFYPPCPHPELVMGCSGHTDVSSLTILQQAAESGLQVLKDELWVPVPPIPHSFVVNIGDMLQMISNNRFKSAHHQAVALPAGCFSIANFFQPKRDTLVQPAAELCSRFKPPVFRSVRFSEYLTDTLQIELTTRGVDRMKLTLAVDSSPTVEA